MQPCASALRSWEGANWPSVHPTLPQHYTKPPPDHAASTAISVHCSVATCCNRKVPAVTLGCWPRGGSSDFHRAGRSRCC